MTVVVWNNYKMLTLTHIEILLFFVLISQIFCFYFIYKLNKKFETQNDLLNEGLYKIDLSLQKSNEYLLVLAKKNGYL